MRYLRYYPNTEAYYLLACSLVFIPKVLLVKLVLSFVIVFLKFCICCQIVFACALFICMRFLKIQCIELSQPPEGTALKNTKYDLIWKVVSSSDKLLVICIKFKKENTAVVLL